MSPTTTGRNGLATTALALLVAAPVTFAQEATEPETAAEEQTDGGEDLLTTEEIETLVAPVALYPDTLLMQILIAATVPIDVVKAERFLDDHPDEEPETLKADIEDQDYDLSVEVLATAFPDVLGEMADNIDWTETVGLAMLSQEEDVLDSIQRLRTDAMDSGALASTEQQTVEVQDGSDTVIIQPADPEIVYVPSYQPEEVFGVNDALVAGAVGFGTAIIIDEIFDDDDDWNDYWGCRNCGGWDDRPIIRDPDIDIDVDGDVIIDRDRVNIDRDRVDIDRDRIDGDRIDRDNIGWKPDDAKRKEARDKVSDRYKGDRPKTLPAKRPSQTDDLRNRLEQQTGTRDISRPGTTNVGQNRSRDLPQISGDRARPNVDRGSAAATKKQAVKRSSASKPQIKRPTTTKKPTINRSPSKSHAIKKSAGGSKARKASSRGKSKSIKRRR